MAKFTDGDWVPEDDPMFNGSWSVFSIRRPASEAKLLTSSEQKIIDLLERSKGRKLSQQEINLSLDQARHLGEL